MKINKIKVGFIVFLLVISILFLVLTVNNVSAADSSVCCEKTKTGLFCQDVPASECASDARQVPTSCRSTSYCKPGVCYDSGTGSCASNTPQIVCNANNGTWSGTSPPQCSLACCVLGDQAAFVTLIKCKQLSSFLGLQTNYNKGITNEAACVLSVQNQDKGACVYDFEFERTCKFTTRAECDAGVNGTNVKGQFFNGKLCTAEELGTKCARTTRTTCVPGKDEVYFVDSCGNPGNIYDASKINDANYWSNVIDKSAACGNGAANQNSPNCGNCNYLQGSICRDSKAAAGATPSYGNYICADLNCKNTQNGNSYKHGESWCVYNDQGTTGQGIDTVGSRFYRHICNNGQEVLEQCADYRQEECIQDKITTPAGTFSQAACRVNRWQDCVAQDNQQDCENGDQRDCFWKPGDPLQIQNKTKAKGACLPKDPPGLQFWQGGDAKSICAEGNALCVVTLQKGLIGSEKCIDNCDCLTPKWAAQKATICESLGDCGPNVNWVGSAGYKPGYLVTIGGKKNKQTATTDTSTASTSTSSTTQTLQTAQSVGSLATSIPTTPAAPAAAPAATG